MKFNKQKRIVVAWLLLLCMLPLSVTKITHQHGREKTACCAEHSHSHDDHETDDSCNCQICKFTLSPFLAVESSYINIFLALIPNEPVTYTSGLHLEAVHTYLLRGPPMV